MFSLTAHNSHTSKALVNNKSSIPQHSTSNYNALEWPELANANFTETTTGYNMLLSLSVADANYTVEVHNNNIIVAIDRKPLQYPYIKNIAYAKMVQLPVKCQRDQVKAVRTDNILNITVIKPKPEATTATTTSTINKISSDCCSTDEDFYAWLATAKFTDAGTNYRLTIPVPGNDTRVNVDLFEDRTLRAAFEMVPFADGDNIGGILYKNFRVPDPGDCSQLKTVRDNCELVVTVPKTLAPGGSSLPAAKSRTVPDIGSNMSAVVNKIVNSITTK
jgi:hypothetical protein